MIKKIKQLAYSEADCRGKITNTNSFSEFAWTSDLLPNANQLSQPVSVHKGKQVF